MSRCLSLPTALLAAVVAALVLAAPASALKACGSAGRPPCVEAPPPGVELELTAEENPHGLQPLDAIPSSGQPLWPRVRGHKPYGFNAHSAGRDGTTLDDEVFLHREIGASMARIGADWAMIQYHPNTIEGTPWNYEAYLDHKYKAYVRAGVRPFINLSRSPRRFTVDGDTEANSWTIGCGTSDACWSPPKPEHLDRLEAFAADVAKRYPLIAGIEVWNEPNISNPFWGGHTPNPEHYAAMLAAVNRGVKRVRPTIPVMGGALTTAATSTTDRYGYLHLSMRTYLRRMLQAGAAASMDALSYHPGLGAYPNHLEPRQQSTAVWHAILAPDERIKTAYADAGEPIDDRMVPTEISASTTYGWTQANQSYWLRMQFTLWDVEHPNQPLSDRVDGAFIHEAVEDVTPPHGNDWQAGFGFTVPKDETGAFTPKQAYCDWRRDFGGFGDCPTALRP